MAVRGSSIALAALLLFVLAAPWRPALPALASARSPYGLAGRSVSSPDGVHYTLYSGQTTSFDGLPMAVDVTIPSGRAYPLPLVVMLHGWGQDRRAWESSTVAARDPIRSGWNNVAFASQGYAVLNYTARGWHDSCGPDDAAVPASPATLPAECRSRQYWVHLADPRWEIHDAQYLIGKLVDQGIVAPGKIAVTGGSYGGGQSLMLALLNDRTVLRNGSVIRWRTPRLGLPLRIRAAVPMYTWSSLTNSLLPNGRAADTRTGYASLFRSPVGVPLWSYNTGLYVTGPALGNGYYSPPGVDPSSDLTAWYARIASGNPFRDDSRLDPVLHRALNELDRRSPLYTTPDAKVPVLQVQGLTDPLFPPVEALMMRNRLLRWDPSYPIKSFFGDLGHANAANSRAVWSMAHSMGHSFLDYYLKGKGTSPAFNVSAVTVTCLSGQSRRTLSARSWSQLGPSRVVLSSDVPRITSSAGGIAEGVSTDPLAHSGCISIPPPTGDGVARWSFPVRAGFTLTGQPRLRLGLLTTGRDIELNTRLWDVSADGTTQTLISRGTYRFVGSPGTARQVSYQISANAWQVGAGHRLRLEISGADSPYYQPNNLPSVTTLTSVQLVVPIAGADTQQSAEGLDSAVAPT
ncbi:MAG: hypothetical protein M3281_09760 [Chloroflexota bacterium]|nr:hypothetical protein [Chloroflexota bacterium]